MTTSPYNYAIDRAIARGYMPRALDSARARVLLLAIGAQESALTHRDQLESRDGRDLREGPALGLMQFELGSRSSRGGVWGVFLHAASRDLLRQACQAAGVPFAPLAIWRALETDDALAFAVGRFLLLTDPKPLPQVGQVAESWDYYARNWRPGKPHPAKWPANYDRALRICREDGIL